MTGKLTSALPESQFPVAWALHWAIDWFWSRTHVSGLFEWVCVSRTWSRRAAKRLTRAGRLNKIRVPFNRMQLAAGLMFLSFGPMAWFIIRSIRWLRLVSLCAVLVSARSSVQHLHNTCHLMGSNLFIAPWCGGGRRCTARIDRKHICILSPTNGR